MQISHNKGVKISLNTQIFLGAFLGVVFGIILGHTGLLLPSTASWFLSGFGLLGKIFIDLLKVIMVPVVFTSIAAGIANLRNAPQSGRAWPALILYSLTTTCLAAATGLTAMNLIKPGVGLNTHLFQENMPPSGLHSLTVGDFIRKLIEGIFTHPLAAVGQNNILAVIMLALLTGIAIVLLGERSRTTVKALNKLFEIMMTIVRWIMVLAPAGIMGLLAVLIARQKVQLLFVLSKYILVVMGTTFFHGAVTLPVILWLTTRMSPHRFLMGMKEAFITAFATSSSTATLPVSLRCITDNLGIDRHVARFVLPVGAALNMDGTAMYEAMAALFVANLCGIHLSLPAQIIVVLTAMTASIGAPGLPSAGMVTMMMVLQSVGLPLSALGLLIAIDRPLDTGRTVVNVEGDCIGACVVQRVAGR
ncbi:MAG: dicarboxylate/amino acid:cation symporter [Candidatus Omnitrophica bacterium]|nr:dicarboxylate/amino acid:cation symporter [Candidatus Omnitrophota bacterium]MDE2008889.1 dicarboxylate/amino acid:cation symporter [Candidatus Omnitrophota bacterium]MDE2213548.1 dicarboxylate/amino acid:cation symporter [Candidatus Omnitrophota bacterium]MDE2230551.1 dicarboxylate/amino acid:cation symporter [Candidatus Omnitrophota bacterium]